MAIYHGYHAKDMKTDVLKDSQIKINQLGVDNSTAFGSCEFSNYGY